MLNLQEPWSDHLTASAQSWSIVSSFMLFPAGRSNQRNHLQCHGWSLAITCYAMASVREPCEGSRHFIENGCIWKPIVTVFVMIQVSDKVCSKPSSNLITSLLLHNLRAIYNIMAKVRLLTQVINPLFCRTWSNKWYINTTLLGLHQAPFNKMLPWKQCMLLLRKPIFQSFKIA